MGMPPPWKLLNAGQLRPKKALGQNFLIDPSTAQLIIRKSGLTDKDPVVEIGPGLGALTFSLARAARVVYAIEKDDALVRLLDEQLRLNEVANVRLAHRDIFDADLAEISRREKSPLMVFGNLPYYISSQLLIYLIGLRSCIRQADLMFQKEVARRLTAVPGTKAYSRLSVMLQYYTDISRTAAVDAHLFWPKPGVDSEVLQFRFKDPLHPPLLDHEWFAAVVKAAFGKRRKTLQNALLGSELGLSRPALIRGFDEAGINPQSRAESLSVAQFVYLANALASK